MKRYENFSSALQCGHLCGRAVVRAHCRRLRTVRSAVRSCGLFLGRPNLNAIPNPIASALRNWRNTAQLKNWSAALRVSSNAQLTKCALQQHPHFTPGLAVPSVPWENGHTAKRMSSIYWLLWKFHVDYPLLWLVYCVNFCYATDSEIPKSRTANKPPNIASTLFSIYMWKWRHRWSTAAGQSASSVLSADTRRTRCRVWW